MQLTKLSTWGVGPFGTTEYAFGRVTAITGRSGSGKTTMLSLIEQSRECVAPLGMARPELSRFIAPSEQAAKVVLDFAFDVQEQQRFGVHAVSDAEILIPPVGEPGIDADVALRAALGWFGGEGTQGHFDAFTAERLFSLGNGTFDRGRYRAQSCATGDAKLSWTEGFLCDVALGTSSVEDANAESVNARLEGLSAKLRLVGARRAGGGGNYLPVFGSGGGERHGVRALSAGERQLATFVAVVTALKPRRSILCVDMLDRDLDPLAQVALLRLLIEGDNQVIFSTHSDALRKAGEVTTVISLDSREQR